MNPIIKELKDKKILQESKGAWLVFFPDEKFPPMMLVKQDGATLYATRDLATDKFRLEKYGKDVTIINEVGAEQSLYFNQLYEVEKMAGWFKEGQRIHIKHGMYRFKDSKMSTRKGNTIWLEDVLKEAEKRAYSLTRDDSMNIEYEHDDLRKKRKMNENNKSNKFSHLLSSHDAEKVAEIIAIGALKWNDLKRSSHMDIVFDWDDILNMQGNSGPYVQYTYVRCKSVLNKANSSPVIPDPDRESREINEEELILMRSLSKYSETVVDSTQNFAPNYLCLYLYDLSQKYNLFYQKHKILTAENEEVKQIRLTMTKAVANVLKHGLNLLGIQTVERM